MCDRAILEIIISLKFPESCWFQIDNDVGVNKLGDYVLVKLLTFQWILIGSIENSSKGS